MKNSKAIISIYFLALFLFVHQGICHNSLSKSVDQLFARWDNSYSPGCAIAVVKNGKIVYKRGYGMANLEYDIPITPSSIFHIASISKQFAAFSILLLESEGKLSLDDDIRTYLPEIPDYGKRIKIRHLIHHTSGLKDQWELLIAAGWRMDDVITQKHILDVVKKQKSLNFDPGEKYLYSNTGFTLLAEIVERVSGMPFARYLKEKIFDPLEMSNTHVHDDHEAILKARTYSYRPAGKGVYKNERLNFANSGATSVFTTVEDFAKWDQNFYDAKVGGKSLMEKMHIRGKLNNGEEIHYACGLGIREYEGQKTVSHAGADAGYRGIYVRFPAYKFSVILFSNIGSFDLNLAYRVTDLYLNLSSEEDSKDSSAQEETRPQLHSSLKEYTGMYANKKGYLFTIIKEMEALLLQFQQDYRIELFFRSEGEFYTYGPDWHLSFRRDPEGRINQFLLNGKDLFKKVELKKISEAGTKEYEGEYYNDELKVMKTIIAKDGYLYITGRNETPDPLIHFAEDSFLKTCSDEFSAKFSEVKFLRDDKKRIKGYRLSTPAAKNLLFKKVDRILYYE